MRQPLLSNSVKNCFLHDRSYTDVLAEGFGTDGDFSCVLSAEAQKLRKKPCFKIMFYVEESEFEAFDESNQIQSSK